MSQLIKNAKLQWNDQGEPIAERFDDLYFSTNDGLAESQYVFIEQNRLEQNWQACTSPFYVIAETGFGSGLNFLATWQVFKTWLANNPHHILKRLYFISFEKYPLSQDDLASAHQRWPQLQEFTQQLQKQYPNAVGGCHRQEFAITGDAMIVLDLWLGDIKDTLPSLHYPPQGLVDSWFLDGFAPSKNPEMWNQTLYQNMAKCTKHNGTLATFTAAGDVRRGLAQAGFNISKVKGYGKKREMITGQFMRKVPADSQTSWHSRTLGQLTDKAQQGVVIVGGGIATAATALALAKRGIEVTIVCKDSELALGASGNRQGGFYPLLNANHDPLSQFYSQAFGLAKNCYEQHINKDPANGSLCGVLQLAHNNQQAKRHQRLLEKDLFPSELVVQVDSEQANKLAGVAIDKACLYYPQGGWISPKRMTNALILQAKQHSLITVKNNISIAKIKPVGDHWAVCGNSEEIVCSALILANGHNLTKFEQTNQLPLYATAGQVSHLPETSLSAPLKTVLCYQGYITPSHNSQHCIGASFNRDISNQALDSETQQENLGKLIADTQQQPWSKSFNNSPLAGKVGVRMSVKDHLPMVGNVPNYVKTTIDYHDLKKGKPASVYGLAPQYPGLYMIAGLGSRGICSAPLLSEVLVAQLTNEPQPLSQPMLNQLSPNRYWIKQLKQGKSLPLPRAPEQQDV